MRVALVHSFYSSKNPSGENIVVRMQADALRAQGHEVHLIAAHTDELEKRPAYKLESALTVATGLGRSPLPDILRVDPDIVHIHNLFPNFSTSWLNNWDGPLVATMHNFRPICSNGLLFRDGQQCTLCPDSGHHNALKYACYRGSRIATTPVAIRNRKGLEGDAVFRRADRIIVLSERSRRTFIQYGAREEQLTVIPNYIDAPQSTRKPHPPHKFWVYAGRLNAEKGILDLAQRWPSKESLLVAGSGELEEQLKHEASIHPEISLIGAIPREELLNTLSGARGVIIPSICPENLPTIYLEALAAGLPIVARAGNAAADDIDRWAPGCTYSDTDGLNRALTQAIELHSIDPLASFRHYQENYTQEKWILRTETLYDDVLCGG